MEITLVRTLQKHKKNGELYLRRPEVEAEITALNSLNVEELESRLIIPEANLQV